MFAPHVKQTVPDKQNPVLHGDVETGAATEATPGKFSTHVVPCKTNPE